MTEPSENASSTAELTLRHRWQKVTMGKWFARFASLLLAVIVWMAVVSEESIERMLTVPIVPYADRENLIWTGDPPGDAVVRVQGKARSIWWLEYITPPEIRIPLSTLPTSGEVKLRIDMVELPQRADVKIVAILKPEQLPVKVERFSNQVLPIHPDVTLIPEEGFTVSGKPTPFPAAVEVTGDHSRLKMVDSIFTEPMTIRNVAAPGNIRLKLLSPSGIKLGRETVEVRYSVERLVEERIENIPVIVPNGWRVEPPWVSVRVSGPASILLSLHKRVPKAHIFTPENGKETIPYIDLPNMVKLVTVTPQTVKVRKK